MTFPTAVPWKFGGTNEDSENAGSLHWQSSNSRLKFTALKYQSVHTSKNPTSGVAEVPICIQVFRVLDEHPSPGSEY